MPIISVIMPAYNVEKYIGEAIESILSQSLADWELIIIDDCSTDNTEDVVNKYITQYPQIKLLKRKQNSGGCRLPRFDGILAAKGEFVCPVDSDDLLEKDYLLKLYNRQQETNSTLVLGRMVICDENGRSLNLMTPLDDFNFSTIESGKEACKKTIGGWKIALNGLLAETLYYKNYIQSVYHDNCNFGFADEIDHRRILLGAKDVAYVDACYFYRQFPNSIIHMTSVKFFDRLKMIDILYNFVKNEFNGDKSVMSDMEYEYIGTVSTCQRTYLIHRKNYSLNERKLITKQIKQCFRQIKKNNMRGRTHKQEIATSCYLMFLLTSHLEQLMKR